MSQEKLVFGVIKGYSYEALQPFIQSLQNSGFSGKIVFMTAHISSSTAEKLRRNNIQVIPFPYWRKKGTMNLSRRLWPFIRPLRGILPYSLMRLVMKSTFHLMDVRHLYLRDYLENCSEDYAAVFVTDVRDVIFQKDPFSLPLQAELEFFQEAEEVKIRDCRWNSLWIKNRFGPAALARCLDKPSHCFGTVRGTPQALIRFVKSYEYVSREVLSYCDGPGDQGTLNHMLADDLIPTHTASIRNLHGTVATLGLMQAAEIPTDAFGRIIHPQSKEIIPVVHQADRFPAINERLLRLLAQSATGRPD